MIALIPGTGSPMSTSMLLSMLVTFGFGYLLGSVPWGLLLTRAAGFGDVRSIGSGNIGATNVLRTGSKKLAALTLFLDGFKGYLAVLLAGAFLAPMIVGGLPTPAGSTGAANAAASAVAALQTRAAQISVLMMSAGLGAFLGHIYPVWLGFKGGKGVATYIGILLGLAWKAGLVFCGLWLLVAFLFRYSSLASLTAAALTPFVVFWLGSTPLALLFALMSALLFYKHKENIERLANGTESKIGAKSAQQEPA